MFYPQSFSHLLAFLTSTQLTLFPLSCGTKDTFVHNLSFDIGFVLIQGPQVTVF